MKYSNEQVRRKDRLLDEGRAKELLETGEWGTMSMCDPDGCVPYGLPISFVWDRESSVYLHCAPQGKKLDIIDRNGKVSFMVVGRTNVLSDKFTTEYESIVLECKAHRDLSKEERIRALELILDKYSPEDKETGLKYASASFGRTEIIRLDISVWSGKSKYVKQSN